MHWATRLWFSLERSANTDGTHLLKRQHCESTSKSVSPRCIEFIAARVSRKRDCWMHLGRTLAFWSLFLWSRSAFAIKWRRTAVKTLERPLPTQSVVRIASDTDMSRNLDRWHACYHLRQWSHFKVVKLANDTQQCSCGGEYLTITPLKRDTALGNFAKSNVRGIQSTTTRYSICYVIIIECDSIVEYSSTIGT